MWGVKVVEVGGSGEMAWGVNGVVCGMVGVGGVVGWGCCVGGVCVGDVGTGWGWGERDGGGSYRVGCMSGRLGWG